MATATLVMDKPAGRRRWMIASLLGVGVIVNYFDRVILTVAAPVIQQDFNISSLSIGLLLGAFGWTYGSLQIPVGMLLDRFGVRRVMMISITLWAAASIVTSMAIGFGTLFIARLLLGIAEAPAFPANAKAVGYWFPRTERSFATAIFDAAAKFSNVIAIPTVALLVVTFGWREAFIATGVLSLLYLVVFRRVYREPGEDTRLSAEERGGLVRVNGHWDLHLEISPGAGRMLRVDAPASPRTEAHCRSGRRSTEASAALFLAAGQR